MSKTSNKKQTATNFNSRIGEFTRIVTSAVEKKVGHPPKVSCKLVAFDMFIDNRRINMYSSGIYVIPGETEEEARERTKNILERSAEVCNAILDENPKTMDIAKKMLDVEMDHFVEDKG